MTWRKLHSRHPGTPEPTPGPHIQGLLAGVLVDRVALEKWVPVHSSGPSPPGSISCVHCLSSVPVRGGLECPEAALPTWHGWAHPLSGESWTDEMPT